MTIWSECKLIIAVFESESPHSQTVAFTFTRVLEKRAAPERPSVLLLPAALLVHSSPFASADASTRLPFESTLVTVRNLCSA